MADLATLTLEVRADGALNTVQRFNRELDKTSQVADKTARSTKDQDLQLRKLVESGVMYSDTLRRSYENELKRQGLWERFLQIQRQVDQEMRVATQVENTHTVAVEKATVAVQRKGVSINSLRSPLSTFAASLIGLNPQIAQLTGLLGGLALGSGVIVGVLGGIAAVSAVYNKLTEDTRKAREETDKFIESLARKRDEELKSTPGGAARSVDEASAALRQRQQELKNLQLSGIGETADIAGGASFGGDPAAKQKRIEEAVKAVRQAEIELSRARVQASKEKLAADNAIQQALEGGEQVLKGVDERRKKADDAEIARLREKIVLLTKIFSFDGSNVLGNIDARLGQNPINLGSLDRAIGPHQTGVSPETAKRQEEESRANIEWQKANAQRILAEGKAAKSLSGLERATQTASQALEYYLVSKIGGGGLGASLGASVAKGALQDYAGGFAKTALGSAIFNPIAAGVGAFVGGLLDSGRAAKEHAKAFAEATRAYKEAREDFAAKANGTSGSLDQQIRNAQREADRQRIAAKEIYDSPAGRNFFPGRYAEELKKIAADEEKYIALLKKEQEIKNKQYDEDLQVRYLRAQGKDKEADALDLKNKQDRERQELIDSFGDEIDANEKARLAFLDIVLAAEKVKQSMDDLTTSVRNAPSGFKIESYTYRYGGTRQPGRSPNGWEGTPPVQPKPFPTAASVTYAFVFPGGVTVDAKDKTPRQAFVEWAQEFRGLRTATTGLNGNPADALYFLPE